MGNSGMNCNKPYRFNAGSLVPGAIGLENTGYGYSPAQPSMGEEDEYAQLLALAQRAGQVPTATQQPKARQGMNWGQLGQMAGMGALAGFGGRAGVAMAPIMAMLMQLPQFKRMMSGKTPGFNPNAKVIDDGKYGG